MRSIIRLENEGDSYLLTHLNGEGLFVKFGRSSKNVPSGTWGSLVAHLVWDQGHLAYAGSNPVVPTG